jgi:hypothetical protein
MAQMGSFVPAQRAEIGICDRIFSRIGASDNLARGESTFMTEMVEFVPQCKLIMMTNYLVDVHAQDEGTWRRIRVVDFLAWFTDNIGVGNAEKPYQYKKDPNLPEKFDSWKSVFMAMLVEIAFKTKGVVKD